MTGIARGSRSTDKDELQSPNAGAPKYGSRTRWVEEQEEAGL